MSEPIVVCRSLSCGYPPRTVLSDIDLELVPGQVVALLGPNGCGKSTLLKTLVRSIRQISGSVTVAGRAISEFSDAELARYVAYVPQDEHPAFPFTVEEIILMGRMPYSSGLRDSKHDREVAEDAMRSSDCLYLRSRSIEELSGGERQRVWIARALAQSAPVLLLDEPTSHLDVGHQVAFVDLARRLAGAGLAICVALHDLNLAAVVADSAILLESGRVGKKGTCSEVLTDSILESVYGVEFERLHDASGRVRVYPRIGE